MEKYSFQNETVVWEISKLAEFSLKTSMVSIGIGTQFYSTGR